VNEKRFIGDQQSKLNQGAIGSDSIATPLIPEALGKDKATTKPHEDLLAAEEAFWHQRLR